MLASTSEPLAAVARLAALPLPGRVHFGLTTAEPVRRLASGCAQLDALLSGGVPCGRISEVVGSLSSGKTAVFLSLLASTTQRGEVVAYVDLADALHPQSVATTGAVLQRVLWVRPRSVNDGLKCTELLVQAGGFALVALDFGAVMPRSLRAHAWPRLLHAAERSHTALIVLAPYRVAGSCAVLSLRLRSGGPRWHGGAWPLFDGFTTTAVLERNKLGAPGKMTSVMVVQSSQLRVESADSLISLDPQLSPLNSKAC